VSNEPRFEPRMIYFETKIVTKNDLKQRSYVEVKINNARFKEYNGNILKLNLHPNKASSLSERKGLLIVLENEVTKAIIEQRYRQGNTVKKKLNKISIEEALTEALRYKEESTISPLYKRNLKRVFTSFIDFIKDKKYQDFKDLSPKDIQDFLNTFISSNTYYMDKRRDLGVLISKANSIYNLNIDAIKKTERRKPKSILHQE